jgi:hypothetical protein
MNYALLHFIVQGMDDIEPHFIVMDEIESKQCFFLNVKR